MPKLINCKKEFKTLTEEKKKVVAYFSAAWCEPCQKIGPVFEKLEGENAEIECVKVDIDDEQGELLAEVYDVMNLPTFVFIQEGKAISNFHGADEGKLTEHMNKLRDA
mmetsp:Transcript_6552/g.16294  ORF Transcript_6552/g.16294 Transcript_6552/m.16294 type:complete len:108 (+) Transcript_6552:59-382(+)